MPEAQVNGQSVRRSLHRRALFSRLHRTQTLVRLLAWCLWSLGFTGGYRDDWGKSEGYADGKRLLLEGDE